MKTISLTSAIWLVWLCMATQAQAATVLIVSKGTAILATIENNRIVSFENMKVDQILFVGDVPDPVDPLPPPSSLRGKVSAWATALEDPRTAIILSEIYKGVAGQIPALGVIDLKKPLDTKQKIIKRQQEMNRVFLLGTNVNWEDGFEAKLTAELNRLQDGGALSSIDEMKVAWLDISKGLQDAGVSETEAIDILAILEIFTLVSEILNDPDSTFRDWLAIIPLVLKLFAGGR